MPVKWSSILVGLLNNKWLKMLAIVLAFIAWYVIQGAISFEVTISGVPLKVLVDDGWSVLDQSVNKVDICFRGSQEDLLRLNRDNIEVTLDVRGTVMEGSYTLPIKLSSVRAPVVGQPISITPGSVNLSLDRESTKQVLVKAEFRGTVSGGFEIERADCNPPTVTIVGPKQRIEDIEAIRTSPIDLDSRDHSFRERIPLAPPSEMWKARIDPQSVMVDVLITERKEKREFNDVEVLALTGEKAGNDVRLKPNRVKVVLEGNKEALAEANPSDIRAYVDCAYLKPADYTNLPVRVHVSRGVRVKIVDPPVVSATISPRS